MSDVPLTPEVIRQRFYQKDTRIDRYGNYVEGQRGPNEYGPFTLLLHYHLLDGWTDAEILKELANHDISPFEANYELKQSKAFIKDVLLLDLETIRNSDVSTEGLIYQEVIKNLETLDVMFKKECSADIPLEINGETFYFQTDEKARYAIANYLLVGTPPKYWVDSGNRIHEPFSIESLRALQLAITERDQAIHEALSVTKKKIREAMEKKDFALVKEIFAELKK